MKRTRRTVGRRAETRALVAALGPGLTALAIAACSGEPKYYDYNPHTNSNNWPYRITYKPMNISYDEQAGLVRVEGVYNQFPPVSNCAEPKGPQYIVHEVPFDPWAEDPFARVRTGYGDGIQYSDASPITEEQFHEAMATSPMDSITFPVEDATMFVGAGGGYIDQYKPPPYSIECGGIVGVVVVVEGTSHERHEGPLLLCGVCGQSRCGDGICDRSTEDATNCCEDCCQRRY